MAEDQPLPFNFLPYSNPPKTNIQSSMQEPITTAAILMITDSNPQYMIQFGRQENVFTELWTTKNGWKPSITTKWKSSKHVYIILVEIQSDTS